MVLAFVKADHCNESHVERALRRVGRVAGSDRATRRRAMVLYHRRRVHDLCPATSAESVPLVAVGPGDVSKRLACVADYAWNLDDLIVGDLDREPTTMFLALAAKADRVLVQPMRPRRLRRTFFQQDDDDARELLWAALVLAAGKGRPVDDLYATVAEDRGGGAEDRNLQCTDAVAKQRSLLASAYDVRRDTKFVVEDVENYYGTAATEMDHCNAGTSLAIPGCTYIMANGAVVHGFARGAGVKQALMDIMLRAITSRDRFFGGGGLVETSNVSFYLDLRATGVRVKRQRKHPRHQWRQAAVLSIAHRGGATIAAPSILAPSPYFLDPRWWANYTTEFLDLAATRPWKARRNVVFFRGSCGPGAGVRIQLLDTFPEDDPLVDFQLINSIGNFTSVDDCVSKVAQLTLPGADPMRLAGFLRRTGPKVPLAQYSRYRYLLHMPGAATGSYSRNLQHLFMHGAIVLIWETTAQEWYYHLLRDRVHYVSVNASTLAMTVAEIEHNSTLRNTLLAGARYVATRILSPGFIFRRWHALLEPLLTKQRHTPLRLPKTACSCDPRSFVFQLPSCSFCPKTTIYDGLFGKGRLPLSWI